MTNKKLVKTIQRLGFVVVGIVLFLMGFVFGDGLKGRTVSQLQEQLQSAQDNVSTQQEVTVNAEMTPEQAKEFLIAYYTRQELGENRNRYQPYMTDGLYRSIVSQEEKPLYQAYKGYVVDQVFDKATIYIDTEHREVIATVEYKNTLLANKNNTTGQSTTNSSKETVKFSYVINNGKALVNTMEKIKLDKETSLNTLPGHSDISVSSTPSYQIHQDVTTTTTTTGE